MKLPVYAKVNLTTGEISEYPIDESLFTQYLGGKALGCRLLTDLMPQGTDPLAPESVLIINTSPATGTGAPSSSRFNLSFKNVLTGGIASSNCGGTFGVLMKRAGYDGLILTGQADRLVTVEIADGDIRIKSAAALRGMDAEKTQAQFPNHWGKLVIGPAGEHIVSFACAVSGERVAGRCGAGAVLGSKRVKALVAFGTKRPEIADPERFSAYTKKWVAFLKHHPMTGMSLPTYGSGGLVSSANASGVLPTRNFQKGRYEHADRISGETLSDTLLVRNSGCVSCPIRCERRVKVDGREVKGPEYETLGLFGANIENDDLQFINELNYEADILGMDTISLAGTIAFAMELDERGIASFGLRFGSRENIMETVRAIALREGKADELANGVKWLSEKYGGEEFAIHAKGLELASYEPRRSVGMGLGYATANRGGCHLNGGYLALIESVSVLAVDPQTPKGKAELAILFQNLLEGISAAGFCLFTAQAVVPGFLFRLGPLHPVTRFVNRAFLAVRGLLGRIWSLLPGLIPFNSLYLLPQAEMIRCITGLPMTSGKLMQLGERSFNMDRLFNLREGLTAADDTLPDRLTKTPQSASEPDTRVPLAQMLPAFYRVRGWDASGVPTERKRKQLGI